MNLLKKIIYWKLSIQFFLITYLRNKLYDSGLIKAYSFDIPVISVGNLAVGGTGKTPMIEFLINNLPKKYKIAVLSRGYKRNSKGFIIASEKDNAKTIGDESFQLFSKFNNIVVAVDKKRTRGIKKLIDRGINLILLDDAFQHRKVIPHYSILLTDYNYPYHKDYLMPRGKLRESKKGAKRADCIIITKCPNNFNKEKFVLKKLINPNHDQRLFFSSINYSEQIISLNSSMNIDKLKGKKVNVVTGIVNPMGLLKYLKDYGLIVNHYDYPDHYNYSKTDIDKFSGEIIITTEKDFTKLRNMNIENLFYLPINVKIDKSDILINNIIKNII